MAQIFPISPHRLNLLSAKDAVKLIRGLVYADAAESKIPINKIDITSEIDVPDGGIDGSVDAERDGVYGIIKKGKTRYQIKSGDFNYGRIRSILFKDNKDELKDRIKSCLDSDATLVIAFTGWDDPDRTEDAIRRKFVDQLIAVSPEYENAKIEVWRQNTIVGFLEHSLPLRLSLLNLDDEPFYSHKGWSAQKQMRWPMHLDEQRRRHIEYLRGLLRDNTRSVHARVMGEPGIGKTKLVLEATRCDDLSQLTIYVDHSEALLRNNFLHKISRAGHENMILVADECDFNSQAEIGNILSDNGSNIKLVTIYNEFEKSSGATIPIYIQELEDAQIAKIFEDHAINVTEVSRWVEWCHGSPYAAHILGFDLKNNPEDMLSSLDTRNAWNRHIAAGLRLDSEEYKTRYAVLLWLSLFRKFGEGEPYEHEIKKIQEIVTTNTSIPPATFYGTITKLKTLKMLQGGTTLNISPKPLHINLWSQWWETCNRNIAPSVEELCELEESSGAKVRVSSHAGLAWWYMEMFEYAEQSEKAQSVAKDFLEKEVFFDF